MPRVNLDPSRSCLLVIDIQPSLVPHIEEGSRVVERARFLTQIAKLLNVPVLSTEQYPERMGSTESSIAPLLTDPPPFRKMCFGACGCDDFMEALRASGRNQLVIVGLETHICIAQTALGLMEGGYEVVVCPDAVGARSSDRHKLGMERMRDGGVVPAHSEAVVYEWMVTSEHPNFKEALQIVKSLGQ